MPTIYFIAMVAMAGFGINVLVINRRRRVNQVFASVCLICTGYFAFTIMARYETHLYSTTHVYHGLSWVRLTWSTTALMPLYLWMLFYVVSGAYRSRREFLLKLLPWTCVSLALIVLVWTEAFLRNDNLPDHRNPGPGYLGFQVVLLVSAFLLLARSLVLAPRLRGIKKLEFQYLTINCAALSIFAVVLPMITVLPVEFRKLVTIPIVCYGISGWSIAARRVYPSRHVYLRLLARTGVLGAVGLGSLWVIRVTAPMESNAYSRVAIIGLFCLAGYWLDEILGRRLRLMPEDQMASVRSRLLALAESETDPDALLVRFETELSTWTQTQRVAVLQPLGKDYVSRQFVLPRALFDGTLFFEDGWVTTVSLDRVRANAREASLLATLKQHEIEAVVAIGKRASSSSVLLALGERDNALPFTYPEIQRLQELTATIDSCNTAIRMRLQVHLAEQLASVGRISAWIVHELRNPMWTLRTFTRMLPKNIGNPQFLESFVRLIPIEAERVHALSEQLLDMVKPRRNEFRNVELHSLISDTTQMLAHRAEEMGVVLSNSLDAAVTEVFADPYAVRQVVINLIDNAIEVLSGQPGPRLVNVRTANDTGFVLIEVEDNGPGISEEIRARLFTPFVTSKKSGLGIGLAICAEIAEDHNGTIEAVSSPKGGALFRLALPIPLQRGSNRDALTESKAGAAS